MHAFPTRSVSNGNLPPPSPRATTASSVLLSTTPRMMQLPPVAPNPTSLQVNVALNRGWHVNTGQHGLARLKRIGPASPRGLRSADTRTLSTGLSFAS